VSDALDDWNRRQRVRIALISVVCLILAGGGAFAVAFPQVIAGWMPERYDVRTERAARERTPAVLNGVDLRLVHGELLTDWWVAKNRRARGGSVAASRAATEALQTALGGDPVLAGLFDSMNHVVAGDLWADADELTSLGEQWNAHIEDGGFGWVVEPRVMRRGQIASFYVKTYEVLADVDVELSGPRRVRMLRRVDGSNVVENHLGHSGDGDAAVLTLDRLTDFVADTLWPMLDPAATWPDQPVVASFGPSVRAEMAAGLSAETYALLVETAPLRRELLAIQALVDDRKHCSNGVFYIDWLGMTGRGLASVKSLARDQKAERAICPVITVEESERLEAASLALQGTRGVEEAVGQLLSWASRKTAVHEARHVADGAVAGVEAPVDCTGCPPEFPPEANAELSAYLATFAEPSMAHTALLQACRMARGGYSFPHLAAMDLVGEALALNGCVEGPPADLPERAARLEQAFFGRSVRAAIPAEFPTWIEPTGSLNRVD